MADLQPTKKYDLDKITNPELKKTMREKSRTEFLQTEILIKDLRRLISEFV